MTSSIDQWGDQPGAEKRNRVRCDASIQQRAAKQKRILRSMTQLYMNIALSLDQRGDPPRAGKQKRIRCKANIQQKQLYIGDEQQSKSINGLILR